ncbi:MAG: esterase [Burkholderiales bacterium]|nr:esterase [Burkholderiales bacterium]
MILYLHGFRSSPQSCKARMMGTQLQALGRGSDYVCPHLPASPKQAAALALDLLSKGGAAESTVIGSSLGGYYATWLAEQTGCRAVLLNPAVKPPRDLDKYVGVTTEYHSDAPFEFKREYIDELRLLEVERITQPERYYLIAATGDEVLDWREMTAHYLGARQRVVSGSDHALSDFERYLDDVLVFCGVKGAAK